MPLTSSQKRYLRGLAHPLHPLVMVGQKGVTAPLLAELAIALEHHELVKVKIANEDRDERSEWTAELLDKSGAELVQSVGRVATLYRRRRDKPAITLPK